MRLVVDTNRIISALIKDGHTRAIICSPDHDFYTLEYVIEEVEKYMDYIVKKSKITRRGVDLLFTLFMQNVSVVTNAVVKTKLGKSIDIMKDIDVNDAPILACALAISNDGIWTEDKHFDKQDLVKVWRTKDLIVARSGN